MHTVIITLLAMSLILVFAKISAHQAVLSPQVAYVIGFVPSLFYLLFYVEKWNVSLCKETIEILVGGAIWFIVVSIFFAYLCKHFSLKKKNKVFIGK